MTNTYYFKLMKSGKLQENNVRIGLAKGKWTFPEDWETKDKALDKEIEDDFFECGITNVSPMLAQKLRKRWDEFFKNYTCADFNLDRSVAQDT